MNNILINNGNVCYSGQYVAFKDFDNREVIAFGANAKDVYERAIAKGHREPVVAFVPIKDIVQIY